MAVNNSLRTEVFVQQQFQVNLTAESMALPRETLTAGAKKATFHLLL